MSVGYGTGTRKFHLRAKTVASRNKKKNEKKENRISTKGAHLQVWGIIQNSMQMVLTKWQVTPPIIVPYKMHIMRSKLYKYIHWLKCITYFYINIVDKYVDRQLVCSEFSHKCLFLLLVFLLYLQGDCRLKLVLNTYQ